MVIFYVAAFSQSEVRLSSPSGTAGLLGTGVRFLDARTRSPRKVLGFILQTHYERCQEASQRQLSPFLQTSLLIKASIESIAVTTQLVNLQWKIYNLLNMSHLVTKHISMV